jgi:branched-chain amino acid transport system substrate-binding protein
MITRRFLLQSAAAVAAYSAQGFRAARAENAPGVTDTEIKIGQTMPYSGPASAYGVIGRTEAAYFKMINEQGGVNGRKINLISLDDAYSPPKTVEQVRRLVEEEQVAFLFQTLGTPPNTAIRQYLNDNKIPQLFVATGAAKWNDPKHFPWTMGWQPNYQLEARIYAQHILKTKPDGKIGVLYQNDDYGKDYLIGLRDGLGADHAGMVIKEVSYETSEPTSNRRSSRCKDRVPTCFSSPPRPNSPPRRSARPTTWVGTRFATSTTCRCRSQSYLNPPASRNPKA